MDQVGSLGRNKEAVAEMISWLKGNSATAGIPVSVEAEKVGLGFETLIPLGDVVFVSKDVAKANGANNMEEALDLFGPRLKKGARFVWSCYLCLVKTSNCLSSNLIVV